MLAWRRFRRDHLPVPFGHGEIQTRKHDHTFRQMGDGGDEIGGGGN